MAGRNKEKGAGRNSGVVTRAARDHLLVLVDGYAFKCRIHIDREVAVLRRIAQPSFTGAVDARSLELGSSPAGIVDTSQLMQLGGWRPGGAVLSVREPSKTRSMRANGASFSIVSSSGKGALAATDLRDKITVDANGYAVTPGGLPTKIKLMSVEEALGRAAEIELHGYRRPRHASQIQAFLLRTPGFASAVRLTLQWLASVGAEHSMPIEAVELLVASVYTEPRPFLPPATASAAFLRVLRRLANFPWRTQVLFVDIDSTAALDTKRSLSGARRRHAAMLSKLASEQSSS